MCSRERNQALALALSCYEVRSRRSIYEIHNAGRNVTGFIGEIWNAIADYLNFTMKVKHLDLDMYSAIFDRYNDCTGSMNLTDRKECRIIPYVGVDLRMLKAMDPTYCFFGDGLRFYVKPNDRFKPDWMSDIYSPDMWHSITLTFLILSTFNFLMIMVRNSDSDGHSLCLMQCVFDCFFTCFGALCNQGAGLYRSQKNLRILSISISLLSWLLITSFSSQIYVYMTQSVLLPPFSNLKTLFEDTNYNVLVVNQSSAYEIFQSEDKKIHQKIKESGRLRYYPSYEAMWRQACSERSNNAAFHSIYQFTRTSARKIACTLEPTGENYRKICIAAAVPKNYVYKEPINHR
ncbi:hypothetical protein QAD02_016917 [Eretmocerus hayati]|uniref:Uncharacterized protein n=1 Tax=Eretmocerus hayati TaxID=131215 RepID=A0ACC2PBX8_9HYME|nr:hypothetical protein QAD02_016917 [Eretmocerus hayati]